MPFRPCTVVYVDKVGTPECGEPAVVAILSGCAHEHLSVDPTCARHQGLLADEELICVDCYKLGFRMIANVVSITPVEDAEPQRREA